MRRADRLFDIIQVLRTATGPVTAAALAAGLEVTVRTIYRDIATLQARRVPIEGAAGIGYVLRRGFDLPPLMFTTEEIEAIAVGARLVARTRDPGLQKAAASVLSKVTVILPEALRAHLVAPPVYVSSAGAPPADAVDLSAVRQAIRDERKLHIAYADETGAPTERTIWPIAIAYYVQATLIGRLVRAAPRLPPFPRRPHRRADGAGRALPVGRRKADGGMAGAAQDGRRVSAGRAQ
ncbi:MAG: YafY family protein [Pseudomonadota bacterium]